MRLSNEEHDAMKINFKSILHQLMMGLAILISMTVTAQQVEEDSLQSVNLNEVILVSSNRLNHQKTEKPLAGLDAFLESSRNVSMVKRGAYAWEPAMNGMASERLSVTIDGMQIFGACTDKMDPITSYVDVSNLDEIQIASGQEGAAYGNSIGGAINLKTNAANYVKKGWSGTLGSSYESNNNLKVANGKVNYGSERFFINLQGLYRKADEYAAGNNEKVQFSQYEKYNAFLNSGYKLSDSKQIGLSFIYDEAVDVGYPALPMDVSLARAFIGSVNYSQDSLFNRLDTWESKIYYNNITHVMDDTTRPDVLIHMDMPGESETFGAYSQAYLKSGANRFFFKLDGYHNRSYAEMTMYPPNPGEEPMFMLTWPDVHTYNVGLYAEDKISFGMDFLKLGMRLGYHKNSVASNFGYNSLKIFYPEMERENSRILKSFSAIYHKMLGDFHIEGGLSYGERAPSVSEGYGFYLFNSFDGFDYIGNPNLSTEASNEVNVSVSYKCPLFEVALAGNFFHISDYIIGKTNSELSPMTLGGAGVKVYENLDYARLMNVSLNGNYSFSSSLSWSGNISYHYGKDNDGNNLPLIAPISYRSALNYFKNQYSASINIQGAGKHSEFSSYYGETGAAAYLLLNAAVGKRFFIDDDDLYVKAGVENIFDTYYVSYADWNNIPRMGRNIHVTVSYSFN